MEINPRESQIRNHATVKDIKAEKCLGFYVHKDFFFFIDEFMEIYMLERKHNSRELRDVKILSIKENSRPDFKFAYFRSIIITEKYMMYGSKIYYLDNSEI